MMKNIYHDILYKELKNTRKSKGVQPADERKIKYLPIAFFTFTIT